MSHRKLYRLLSAVAHGHGWAIYQLNMEPEPNSQFHVGGVAAQHHYKAVDPIKVKYLAMGAAKAFARALWAHCRYAGLDGGRLVSIFEKVFDQLQMATEVRFWR